MSTESFNQIKFDGDILSDVLEDVEIVFIDKVPYSHWKFEDDYIVFYIAKGIPEYRQSFKLGQVATIDIDSPTKIELVNSDSITVYMKFMQSGECIHFVYAFNELK